MKTNRTTPVDFDLPEGGVFADISHLIATAPPHHPMHQTEAEEITEPWAVLSGSSFPDIDPWSRGGLNE
jgi:hypothetical protein